MGFLFDSHSKDRVIQFGRLSSSSKVWVTPEYSYPYEVMLTPRGDFTIGKLATEKNAVSLVGNQFTMQAEISALAITFATVVKTTKEFRAMDPSKRNCLYPDEKKLVYYPQYSEANCMLECAWNQAEKACQCVPWFLKELFPRAHMCELFGNKCFKDMINARYRKQMRGICQPVCLPDCETTEFQVNHPRRERIGHKAFCRDKMYGTEEEKAIICGYFDEKYTIKDPAVRELANNDLEA